MAVTYNSLATTTVATSGVTQTITFSSISAAYTDLVLIVSNARTSTASTVYLRINGDTAVNYSHCRIAQGTASSSAADDKIFAMTTGLASADGNATYIGNFMSYSNATLRKVIVGQAVFGGTVAGSATGASWFSTAAINSISILASSGFGYTFDAGTVVSLYGILRA